MFLPQASFLYLYFQELSLGNIYIYIQKCTRSPVIILCYCNNNYQFKLNVFNK